MNTVEEQVQDLLRLVDEYRQRRCDQILSDARRQADELIREAHREARRRMHRAVMEDRARSERSVASAEAHLQTLKRRHQQRRTIALLEIGWEALMDALRARWREAPSRREWVAYLLEDGLRLLPKAAWIILHPMDWPDGERERFRQDVIQHGMIEPRWTADPKIMAGLILSAGGATLDGTLEGFIADRRAIEARLLDLL